MIGPLNDLMRGTVSAAMLRRAIPRGTCLYYQHDRCISDTRPKCPHWDYKRCLGEGDCNNFCAHYHTPPAILREEEGLR